MELDKKKFLIKKAMKKHLEKGTIKQVKRKINVHVTHVFRMSIKKRTCSASPTLLVTVTFLKNVIVVATCCLQ